MTISELLNAHFSKDLKKEALTPDKLRKAAKETFEVKDLSEKERAALLSMISTSYKMEGKEHKYFYRTMGQVEKDLKQLLTGGIFGEEKAEKRFESEKQAYLAKKAEAKEGAIVLPQFSEKHSLMRSSEVYKYVINKLGEIKVEENDGKRSFTFVNLQNQEPMKNTETQKLVLTSLVESIGRLADEHNKNSDEKAKISAAERDCVVYLASMLVLENLNNERDKASHEETALAIEEAFGAMLPYLAYSIDESIFKEPNSRIFELATRLAKNRIGEINRILSEKNQFADNVYKHFKDAKFSDVLYKSVNNFTDLRVAFDEQGSNFSFSVIDDKGIELFFNTIRRPETEEDASAAFKSKNVATVLSGFAFLDYKMLEDETDRDIDTYEEAAQMLLTNLLVAEHIDISQDMRKSLQQIFVFPFIQAYSKLSQAQQKEIRKGALENIVEFNDFLNVEVTQIFDIADYGINKLPISNKRFGDVADFFRTRVKEELETYVPFRKWKKASVKKATKIGEVDTTVEDADIVRKRITNNVIRAYRDEAIPENQFTLKMFAGEIPNEIALPKIFDADNMSDEEYEIVSGMLEKIYTSTYLRFKAFRDATIDPETGKSKRFTKEERHQLYQEHLLTADDAKALADETLKEFFETPKKKKKAAAKVEEKQEEKQEEKTQVEADAPASELLR